MKEIWKKIIGYEGIYSISNHGRVRRDCSVIGSRINYILKGQINSYGYREVSLRKNGRRKAIRVHKVVMINFYPQDNRIYKHNERQINHKDLNKLNNKLENLEYVTASQNMKHYFKSVRKNAVAGSYYMGGQEVYRGEL